MWPDNMSYLRNPSTILHKKRKGESLMDIMPPLKMHINEEKMVSQLEGIHLSHSYTSHGTNSTESDTSFLEYVLDNTSRETESLPSLKICDELKSQFNPTFKFNSTVPNSILQRFNKECTALVLWQPPVNSISRTLSVNGDQKSSEEKFEDSSSGYAAVASSSSVQPELIDVDMLIDDDNNNSMRENST